MDKANKVKWKPAIFAYYKSRRTTCKVHWFYIKLHVCKMEIMMRKAIPLNSYCVEVNGVAGWMQWVIFAGIEHEEVDFITRSGQYRLYSVINEEITLKRNIKTPTCDIGFSYFNGIFMKRCQYCSYCKVASDDFSFSRIIMILYENCNFIPFCIHLRHWSSEGWLQSNLAVSSTKCVIVLTFMFPNIVSISIYQLYNIS